MSWDLLVLDLVNSGAISRTKSWNPVISILVLIPSGDRLSNSQKSPGQTNESHLVQQQARFQGLGPGTPGPKNLNSAGASCTFHSFFPVSWHFCCQLNEWQFLWVSPTVEQRFSAVRVPCAGFVFFKSLQVWGKTKKDYTYSYRSGNLGDMPASGECHASRLVSNSAFVGTYRAYSVVVPP